MASGHPPLARGPRILLGVILVPLVVATVVGLVALRPTGHHLTLRATTDSDATVLSVRRVSCADGVGVPCFRPVVRLGNGATATLEDLPNDSVRVGDAVTVALGEDGVLRLAGHRHGNAIFVVLAVAALALLAIGWLTGARVLVALGVAVVVTAAFAVPAIVDGRAALGVAIVAAAAIAIALMALLHGVGARPLVALAGALLAVVVVGAVGQLVGLVAVPPSYLHVASGRIPMDGLLLAGVLVGSVGALVDLAARQVDATWHLGEADPEARWWGITRAGVRAGRADLAGATTTLGIAYLGVAVPALVLLTGGVSDAVRGETLAVELGRAALGIVALTSVVPLTSALAAAVIVGEARAATKSSDPRHFRARRERLWEDET